MQGSVTGKMVMWPVDMLTPNPLNPRGPVTDNEVPELVESVRRDGILQPLTILPNGTIVMGHRRHHAAVLAGLTHVPAIVKAIPEDQQLRLMFVENAQRQDLTLLQQAKALGIMVSKEGAIGDVARSTGVMASRIGELLSILKLPEDVQDLFGENRLTLSAAVLLAQVEDIDALRRLASFASNPNTTLAALKRAVHECTRKDKPPSREHSRMNKNKERPKGVLRDAIVVRLQESLERQMSYADVQKALDYVCCACGMAQSETGRNTVCMACPLPQFLNVLMDGVQCPAK